MQYKGVGIRFLALVIDSVLTFVVVLVVNLSFISGFVTTQTVTTNGTTELSISGGYLIAVFLMVVASFLYYVVLEAVWGATLGKMICGIKVVMEDGTKCSWTASLIRNLLRLIDGLFSYLLGAIFIWTSPKKQRLGDRLARTVVVARNSVPSVSGGTPAQPVSM